MKIAMKRLFLVMALVMSFAIVQAVFAEAEIVTLEGTVTSTANRAIALDEDGDGVSDVTVYHMGPPSYWEQEGISYPDPAENTYLIIDAYCNADGQYVAVSLCYSDGVTCIDLRDVETLTPLWAGAKIAEPSVLSATDSVCPNPDCPSSEPKDYEHDYDYNAPGPHKK